VESIEGKCGLFLPAPPPLIFLPPHTKVKYLFILLVHAFEKRLSDYVIQKLKKTSRLHNPETNHIKKDL